MNLKWKIRVSTLIVAGSLVALAPASAAHLKVISRKVIEFKNGKRVVPGSQPSGTAGLRSMGASELRSAPKPATGQMSDYFSSIGAPAPPAGGPGQTDTFLFSDTPDVKIVPDAGEADGQCALVDFSYSTHAHVEATGGALAQLAIGGLGGSAAATLTPLTATASVNGPASIVLNPSGSATTEFSHGPLTLNPGDPDQAYSHSGTFSAKIGDTFRVTNTGVYAWAVPAGDTLNFEMDASFEAAARSCSVVQIPALNLWGLLALTLLLAGGGLLLTRRMGT